MHRQQNPLGKLNDQPRNRVNKKALGLSRGLEKTLSFADRPMARPRNASESLLLAVDIFD